MELNLGNKLSTFLIVNRLVVLISLLLLSHFSIFAIVPGWFSRIRSLTIASSTRKDVETIFGNPRIVSVYDAFEKEPNSSGVDLEYKIREGDFEVSYSSGTCKETSRRFGYDVTKDVLTEITFRPKKKPMLKSLGLNTKNFNIVRVDDVVGSFIHYSPNGDIEIATNQNRVLSITFGLSKDQFEELSCKRNK
jgi:hypothetical protein